MLYSASTNQQQTNSKQHHSDALLLPLHPAHTMPDHAQPAGCSCLCSQVRTMRNRSLAMDVSWLHTALEAPDLVPAGDFKTLATTHLGQARSMALRIMHACRVEACS